MPNHSATVISDANVLIDYISVERTLVLRLMSEHLFPIKLPRAILNEVDQLTEDQAEALGMEIVEETIDQLKEAAVRGGALRPRRGRTGKSIPKKPRRFLIRSTSCGWKPKRCWRRFEAGIFCPQITQIRNS